MIVAQTSFTCAEDAYRRGRRFVLGSQEEFMKALAIPGGANPLCRLLKASVKDAFEKANPVVLVLCVVGATALRLFCYWAPRYPTPQGGASATACCLSRMSSRRISWTGGMWHGQAIA
ncbi:hypothetical protein Y032_0094g2764 [Ancylostoma ceylanicum]|nr:hypothetical protein Y032_0094g2764 [Ancylostoma ceylanicum]